jgi:hypothetical protein
MDIETSQKIHPKGEARLRIRVRMSLFSHSFAPILTSDSA